MAGCSLHVCRGVSRKDWHCSSISDSSVRRKRVLISKISPLQEPEPFSASSRRLYGFPVCLTAIVSMASLLISNLHSTIENRSRIIVQGSNSDSLTITALLTQGPPTADRTVTVLQHPTTIIPATTSDTASPYQNVDLAIHVEPGVRRVSEVAPRC
jgi:hypothetical protein